MCQMAITPQTKLLTCPAPGIQIHVLPDGSLWVTSENELFAPIYLGNRHDEGAQATHPSMEAVRAVARLTQVMPAIGRALAAIRPVSQAVYQPAPGYKVIASHRDSNLIGEGWYVEDTHGHYVGSEDLDSPWEACLAALNHHLSVTPEPALVLAAASKYADSDNNLVRLDEDAIVSRTEGNPKRGAYVRAWLWVPDEETAEPGTVSEVAVIPTQSL